MLVSDLNPQATENKQIQLNETTTNRLIQSCVELTLQLKPDLYRVIQGCRSLEIPHRIRSFSALWLCQKACAGFVQLLSSVFWRSWSFL